MERQGRGAAGPFDLVKIVGVIGDVRVIGQADHFIAGRVNPAGRDVCRRCDPVEFGLVGRRHEAGCPGGGVGVAVSAAGGAHVAVGECDYAGLGVDADDVGVGPDPVQLGQGGGGHVPAGAGRGVGVAVSAAGGAHVAVVERDCAGLGVDADDVGARAHPVELGLVGRRHEAGCPGGGVGVAVAGGGEAGGVLPVEGVGVETAARPVNGFYLDQHVGGGVARDGEPDRYIAIDFLDGGDKAANVHVERVVGVRERVAAGCTAAVVGRHRASVPLHGYDGGLQVFDFGSRLRRAGDRDLDSGLAQREAGQCVDAIRPVIVERHRRRCLDEGR